MPYKIKVSTLDEANQVVNLTSTPNPILMQDFDDVQSIFGVAEGTVTIYNVVIGSDFDTVTFSDVRFIAYLMQQDASVVACTSCTFNIYDVSQPNWTENLLYTAAGVAQPNNYFYLTVPESTLGIVLDGGPTIMIEAVILRSGKTYKYRIYANQLGSYESIVRSRRELAITNAIKIKD